MKFRKGRVGAKCFSLRSRGLSSGVAFVGWIYLTVFVVMIRVSWSYAGTTCTKSSHILNERESNHVIYINSAFETLFFLKASSMEIWISERKKSASSYLQYFKTSQLSRCESCDFQLSGEEMYSWNQEERLVSSRVLVNLFLSVAFTPLVYSFWYLRNTNHVCQTTLLAR